MSYIYILVSAPALFSNSEQFKQFLKAYLGVQTQPNLSEA